MPLFGSGTGFPLPNPLSPIHADPVARAIGPGANRNRPHRGQLGWPQIRRLRTIAPLPASDLRRLRTRLPLRHAPSAPEGLPDTPQRIPVSDGYPSARSDPTPSQLPVPDADSPLPSDDVSRPGTRLRWPVNLSCPDPASTSSAVWAGLPTEVEAPSSPPRFACAVRNDAQLRRYKTPGQVVFLNSQGYPRNFPVTPRIRSAVHEIPTVHAQATPQLRTGFAPTRG